MEVTGQIYKLGETYEVGKKGFLKRDLVIKTEEQYPQTILIEFVQDKTQILDKYSVGQNVKVGINLRGREWINKEGEAKYFNSLNGWRIEEARQEQVNQAPDDKMPWE